MRIWVFLVPQRRKELHTATTDSTKLSVSTLLSQRVSPLWQALGRRSMGRYTGATRMCCGNPEGRGRVGKTNKLIGGCGLFVPLLWQGSYFHIASEAILFKLFIAFFNQIAKLGKNLYIYIHICIYNLYGFTTFYCYPEDPTKYKNRRNVLVIIGKIFLNMIGS